MRKLLRDPAQRRLHRVTGCVLDAAGLHEQREEQRAVDGAVPAVAIAGGGELEAAHAGEGPRDAAVDLRHQPRHALLLDHILQPRVLAVGAVAEVAVDREHGLGDLDHLLGREEADDVRQPREGLHVAVAAAHAAADREVVADQLVLLDHGDEPEVVRVDVHVVHRRDHERRLELPRQVGAAIERIDEVLVRRLVEVQLHVLDPDAVVGLRLRRERMRQAHAVGKDLLAGARVRGRGRGGDVAVDVAAGREGGKQRLVDVPDDRTEAGLEHPVELDALARREAQGLVAVVCREVVKHDPLRRRHHATRDPATDHHHVLLARFAEITVVLLVDPVKLEELLVILAEAISHRVRQGAGNVSGQGRNLLFQELVLGRSGKRGVGHRVLYS